MPFERTVFGFRGRVGADEVISSYLIMLLFCCADTSCDNTSLIYGEKLGAFSVFQKSVSILDHTR